MNECKYKVQIQDLLDIEAVYVSHSNTRIETKLSFNRLYSWLLIHALNKDVIQHIRVLIDSPFYTENHLINSRICAQLKSAISIPYPLKRLNINGGRYAVISYFGDLEELPFLYDWVIASWLVESKNILRNGPIFETYPDEIATNSDKKLNIVVYLPI